MRVLIADDDVVLRRALRAHLERWEYQVSECADGVAALEALLEPQPPPMAIVDWQMPGLDGPALCGELRSRPSLSSMYVIPPGATRRDVMAPRVDGIDIEIGRHHRSSSVRS